MRQKHQQEADLLVLGEWILLSANDALQRGAIAVRDGLIVDVGPQRDVMERYRAKRVIGGADRIVAPGLINTHTHLFQTFLRGLGEGLPLRTWVERVTTPAALAMTWEDAYLSAALGLIEALHSGTTAVFEYGYAFPDPSLHEATLKAFLDVGVRGWLGIGVNDAGIEFGVHPAFIQTVDEALKKVDDLRVAMARLGQMPVQLALVSGSIRGLSSQGVRAFHGYAEANGLLYSLHLKEIPQDDETALLRFGTRAVPWLADCGVLKPNLLAVHCVWLNQEDIDLLAEGRSSVSHNPVSNMYLGAGIAPVAELLQRGIAVGLGTDGPASNNSMDMLQTLKFSILGQRARKASPDIITSRDGFRMATEDAARALGVEGLLGRIAPGYVADIVVFRTDTFQGVPCHDPYATLAFSAGCGSVETVMVGGRIVLEEGLVKTLDEADIVARASTAAKDLVQRAGIPAGVFVR